jgi:hypothetical protein
MSVIPTDQPPSASNGAVWAVGLWHRLANALDAYLVRRSKQTVSAITLRRCDRELARCRRLMHKKDAVAEFASAALR